MGEDNDHSKNPSTRRTPKKSGGLVDEQTLRLDLQAFQETLRTDSRTREHAAPQQVMGRGQGKGQGKEQAETVRVPAVAEATVPVAMPEGLIAQSRAERGAREDLVSTTQMPRSVSFEARVEADGRIALPAELIARGRLRPGMVLRITAWADDEEL